MLAPGPELRLLDVEGPDLGALGVVQHRQVLRARQVVFRELAGTAHVDHRVEARQRDGVDGREPVDGVGHSAQL